MALGVRFIHTADWQLGLRAGHVPGDQGAAVRLARMDTVKRIADFARVSQAAFVVVAGDVFEHHALDREPLQRTFEAFRAFSCEVFLLPGNHDPYTPDALYRSDWWRRECPSHIKVLGRPVPVEVGNAILLPCPLLERDNRNATGWLNASVGAGDRVRVGIAHGGIPEILQALTGESDGEFHNDVPLGLADNAALDYLALGDWHSRLQINERTWYSGTPEPTRFKEQHPGDVLLVEVDRPRAAPKVTPHRVARFQWERLDRKLFTEADLVSLERDLDALPDRGNTLVDLVVEGTLDITLRNRVLQDIVPRHQGRFHYLRLREDKLFGRLSDDDYNQLPMDGWIGGVVQALRAGLPGRSVEECQDALLELHALHHSVAATGSAR